MSFLPICLSKSMGSFHSTQNSGNFGWFRPEYSGPALKVVHFDRSGHFGRTDRNVPFHLTKLLFPLPLFCVLLKRTIPKRAVAWVGSVQPEYRVPLGVKFPKFQTGIFVELKAPHVYTTSDNFSYEHESHSLQYGQQRYRTRKKSFTHIEHRTGVRPARGFGELSPHF